MNVEHNINTTQHQVWCELHSGYVKYWEAMIVSNDRRKQRPAENDHPGVDEYTACIDCLAEEIHPLPLAD